MPTYNMYNRKIQTKQSYFCPNCIEFASLEITNVPTATITINQRIESENFGAEIRGLDVLIKCPKCGKYMKPIGNKMVNYIKRFVLDKKIALTRGTTPCDEGHFEGPDCVASSKNIERYEYAYIRFAYNIELYDCIKSMSEEIDKLVEVDATNLGIRVHMPFSLLNYNDEVEYGIHHYKLFCEKQRDFFKALDMILDALPDKFTTSYQLKRDNDISYGQLK